MLKEHSLAQESDSSVVESSYSRSMMLKSIEACMAKLEDEEYVMEEMLEALLQELPVDSSRMKI